MRPVNPHEVIRCPVFFNPGERNAQQVGLIGGVDPGVVTLGLGPSNGADGDKHLLRSLLHRDSAVLWYLFYGTGVDAVECFA